MQENNKVNTLKLMDNKKHLISKVFLVCAGLDLNQRSPEATDLQSVVIDHSTTDA